MLQVFLFHADGRGENALFYSFPPGGGGGDSKCDGQNVAHISSESKAEGKVKWVADNVAMFSLFVTVWRFREMLGSASIL